MTASTILSIGVFWAMQVIAQLFFKWGSTSEARWLWGFIGGNAFGLTSVWLLMVIYKAMNPNVALGIGMGGSFLLSQLALALVFKSEVSFSQWGGVFAIVAGVILLAAGKHESL